MVYLKEEWESLINKNIPADEISAIDTILNYCYHDESMPCWYESWCDIYINKSSNREHYVAEVLDYTLYRCEFLVNYHATSVTIETVTKEESEKRIRVIAAFQYLCKEDTDYKYNTINFDKLPRYQLNIHHASNGNNIPFVTRCKDTIDSKYRNCKDDISWGVKYGSESAMYEEAYYTE
jgi:hypothetical protein